MGRPRLGITSITLVKTLFLAALDAGAVYFAVVLAWQGSWGFLSFLLLGAGGVNFLLLSHKAYPLRYLFPGLFFLLLMVVVPVGYNIYLSFTNYSTGHILTKEEVIRVLTSREYAPTPPVRFPFYAFGTPEELYGVVLWPEAGPLLLWPDGRLASLEGHQVSDTDADGIPDVLDGRPRLSGRELLAHYGMLQALRVPWENGWLRLATLREFGYFLPQFLYDPEQDMLVDQRTGIQYRAGESGFYSPDG
ncbi:MAG TPA: hypothetical protein ENI38_04390, partial [Candidatus Acetothermia bacterium]|nr:hypothetical protein [Candidatus Acetothermia bacterium]